MNIELRNRIGKIKEYMDDKLLSEEPRRWWQRKVNDYIPTRDMAGGRNNYPQSHEETIVKYDFKRALKSGAFFIIIACLITFVWGVKGEAFAPSFWMMNIIMLLAVCWPLISSKKKGPLMIFNKEGFLIGNMPELVPWEYLATSYIRKDDSGEDSSYYLLLFYYEETTDEFKEIEYSIDGLDMSKGDIALQIEYWKMISGNTRRLVDIR